MTNKEDSEWLLGLDLSDRGQGALVYGAWLKAALGQAEHRDRFVGVHILEEPELRPLLRYHRLDELERKAEQLADRVTHQLEAEDLLEERRILRGRSAEDLLAELAKVNSVRGLIIGRQAKRGQSRIVRLGRVARRLLRMLPTPTIVVPPDLRAPDIGSGPVVLATNAEADSAHAAAFAKTMAEQLQRPLMVAHVVPVSDYVAGGMVPAAATGELIHNLRLGHQHKLRVWMHNHDLLNVSHQTLDGPIAERIAELAEDCDSPLVVCGSRCLGLGMRLFSSSVASDLAATCRAPVAVVPSRSEAAVQAA